MIAGAIDRIDAALAPHSRAVSIAAGLWFWLGIALYANFIRLPEIPFLSPKAIFWTGVVFNAVWWGWLHPAIESRRSARAGAESHAPPQA